MNEYFNEFVARKALSELFQLQKAHDALGTYPAIAFLPVEYIDLMDRAELLVRTALEDADLLVKGYEQVRKVKARDEQVHEETSELKAILQAEVEAGTTPAGVATGG